MGQICIPPDHAVTLKFMLDRNNYALFITIKGADTTVEICSLEPLLFHPIKPSYNQVYGIKGLAGNK